MATRAPKQWSLTTSETLTSFCNWKENLCYTLSLDANFTPFLANDFTWDDGDSEFRGLINDPNEGAQIGKTKQEKAKLLVLMLGQIANYCNIIARHQIVYESTSLDYIWNLVREHYGFNVTGSRFLDLATIKLEAGERPADLYQRLVSFFTDNLYTKASKLRHKGKLAQTDEKLSVSLQNTIIALWLEKLHSGLPGLVKCRYATDLRDTTLASIKPEISQALDQMLHELRSSDDSRVMRLPQPSGSYSSRGSYQRPSNNNSYQRPSNNYNYRNNARENNPRICSLCKTANISGWDTHFLSQCKYISDRDRKTMSMSRVRYTNENDYAEDDELCDTMNNELFIDAPPPATMRRVITMKSPHMSCFYNHYPTKVCLDSGSESSLVSERFASSAGIPILTQSIHQGAVQADSTTRLTIIGEVKNVKLRRGSHVFSLDALVTKSDIGDVIAGEPFLSINDIALRPSKKQIIIRGNEVISYSNDL